MSEQPEWTPEQQEVIDYWARLDDAASAIGVYMMEVSNLPQATIRKLLPLAEIAWRDKDPTGALVFLDIDSDHPRVDYIADTKSVGGQVQIGLYELGSDRCVIPLEPIFSILTHRAKGVQ